MGEDFKELASIRTDKKKYNNNYDKITWGNKMEKEKEKKVCDFCGSEMELMGDTRKYYVNVNKKTIKKQRELLEQKDERIKALIADNDNFRNVYEINTARIKEIEEVGVKWMDKSVALDKQLDEANKVFNSIINSEGHLSGYLWLDEIKEYQTKHKGE